MNSKSINDYTVNIKAGEQFPLDVIGEFVHVKNSNGALEFSAGDSRVVFDEGQGGKIGEFKSLLIKNKTASDIIATLVIGGGDFYNAQISGEISVKSPGGLNTFGDNTIAAGSKNIVFGDPDRRELIVSNPSWNPASFRIGDINIGANRGIEVQPGVSWILTYSGDIWIFNTGVIDQVASVTTIQ